MAENSPAAAVGKFGLGLGVGFGLYWLIRNLGLGSGLGFGGGPGDARGDGTGEAPAPEPPAPRPRDEEPLLFWVEDKESGAWSSLPDPSGRTREDARFFLLDLGGAKLAADEFQRRLSSMVGDIRRGAGGPALSLDEVIARVQAGSRDDVRLMTSGAIRSGTWDDAKDALMHAGIKHWLLWKEIPADRKPGDPPKPPHWDLYDKVAAVGNPDKEGHYLVEKRGTSYWNLAPTNGDPPLVSGRGVYGGARHVGGRGCYRSRW